MLGRFLTSVKRNGQAKEQLFSIWISDRLIDTEKETLMGFSMTRKRENVFDFRCFKLILCQNNIVIRNFIKSGINSKHFYIYEHG
jgi:hypothetical protein